MIPFHEILLRLLLGALIGGVIGLEREVHGRAAGFRTQLIVCVAAVLIMIVSENYHHHIRNLDPSLRIDPARISAGAIIGIGFLGGGVIIKSGYAVRGLTTAASIWIVSAIGLAIGGGLYYEGLTASVITILALVVLRIMERKVRILRFKDIKITTPLTEKDTEEKVRSILTEYGLNMHTTEYEKNQNTGELIYHFTVSTKDMDTIREIFLKLSSIDSINTVRISG